jgi:glucose-1-phosphate adenylyltransferase
VLVNSDVDDTDFASFDTDGRVTNFEEKPKHTRSTLASMGIYVFSRELLIDWLAGEGHDQQDFGRDV